jgi:L-lactate dehydrogenase complex protein LldG
MSAMQPTSARDRILGRLRAAAAASSEGTAPDAAGALSRRIDAHYASQRVAAGEQEAGRIGAFHACLEAAHAQVWVADAASWPGLLAEQLVRHGVRRLLLDPARPEGAALARALPAQVQALPFAAPIEDWKQALFDSVDAGFTVARSGIAATGTLVLAPDAGTPRTVSLVPPLHVALVYARTLHADLHAAMQAEQWPAAMPTNLVLVSGPSKTSDIQQTLAYGAHGPARLWVVVVTASASGREGETA